MYSLTRLAVIIGSQSPGNTFLQGVEPDVNNLTAFLLSPNGGAWQRNEIMVMVDPRRDEVLQTIWSAMADYVFVYFSGHGYTNNYGERMVALTDGALSDISLLCDSPRQLVIVDACRVHEKGGAAIGAIPWHREKWLNADGPTARALFDHYISNSPAGRMIVHAAKDNQSAYEDGARPGGRFTISLLDNIFSRQQLGRYGACYIRDMLKEVSPHMLSFMESQQPEIVYNEGYLSVPFGITSGNFYPRKPRVVRPMPAETPSNRPGWLMLAGLAMILYGLSE